MTDNTENGRYVVGFEYNGVQVVMPKIEMFIDDKIETTGLFGGLRHSHVWTDEGCFFGADTAKGKDCTVYSRKSKIPSQTKPSCELGKAQKDFMAKLNLSGGD